MMHHHHHLYSFQKSTPSQRPTYAEQFSNIQGGICNQLFTNKLTEGLA
jgi:hypothetical protein